MDAGIAASSSWCVPHRDGAVYNHVGDDMFDRFLRAIGQRGEQPDWV
jgi:hypothetical protein